MAEANWFWAEGDKRNGPVLPGEIAKLVSSGKLGPDDLIWKEGMPDWITISKVPALMKFVKTPIGAPDPVVPMSVGIVQPEVVVNDPAELPAMTPMESVAYYNPSGAMPPRAALTLAKHAAPRGDVGDWPLDDTRVGYFDQALKLRKQIDGAASLYRLLLLLSAIGDAGFLVGVIGVASNARGGLLGPEMMGLAFALCIAVGLTVLHYFTWKHTQRSQRWAPLTMGILFVLGGLFYLVTLGIMATSSMRDVTPIIIGVIIIELFATVFAFVSFRAFAAIPKYLLQPAWCQELLSKTSR